MGDPALAAALRMLGRRGYFRAELAERLRRKGFDEGDVTTAVVRCAELGYLDDDALAARFVETRAAERGWGPRRLAFELARRGLERERAEAHARLDEVELKQALETALERLERRARSGWWRLPEVRGRMVSSLLGRGFDVDDARRAVDSRAALRERQHHARDDEPGDPPDLP